MARHPSTYLPGSAQVSVIILYEMDRFCYSFWLVERGREEGRKEQCGGWVGEKEKACWQHVPVPDIIPGQDMKPFPCHHHLLLACLLSLCNTSLTPSAAHSSLMPAPFSLSLSTHTHCWRRAAPSLFILICIVFDDRLETTWCYCLPRTHRRTLPLSALHAFCHAHRFVSPAHGV